MLFCGCKGSSVSQLSEISFHFTFKVLYVFTLTQIEDWQYFSSECILTATVWKRRMWLSSQMCFSHEEQPSNKADCPQGLAGIVAESLNKELNPLPLSGLLLRNALLMRIH